MLALLAMAALSSATAQEHGEELRPVLSIEHDPDGAAYLRVAQIEQEPFAAKRETTPRSLKPSRGTNIVISGTEPALASHVALTRMKYGLSLQDTGPVHIADYSYVGFDGGGGIYGGAIKLGDNHRPAKGPTWIERVFADGQQQPDATYKISNTDFLGIEGDGGSVFVRDVTARNFGDAGVDSKSSPVYVMNATIDGAHRGLRAWSGVEITLVNSIVNVQAGQSQAWVRDGTASVRYFNTLWCEGSQNPSAADPRCRRDPWLVEGEDMKSEDAARRVIRLSSNPLERIDPLFRSPYDEIALEVSADKKKWRPIVLPNTGAGGEPLVGDRRYRLPPQLPAGPFLRAKFRAKGEMVGDPSSALIVPGG